MKFRLLIALLSSFWFVPAQAAQNLNTYLLFDTHAFPCTASTSVATYTNNTGSTLYIRQVQTFMGMSVGAKGDFWMTVRRAADGQVMQFTNWDHYAEPVAPHNLAMNYEPNYMAVAPGGIVWLEYGCWAGGPPYKNGQIVVYAWTTPQP